MKKILEIKIITLGNYSVGKSSFISKYVDNYFTFNYISTLGVDFKQKEIKLKNGKNAILRIFDTAGQERFRAGSVNYIKHANGVILIYDIGNVKSFKSLNDWMETISEIGKEKLQVILVGNKCDISDKEREVSVEEGKDKADEFKIPFFETSCKDGININKVFEKLIEDILNKGVGNHLKKNDMIFKKEKNKKKCC